MEEVGKTRMEVVLPQARSGISSKRNREFHKDGYCLKILKEEKG